MSLNSKIRNYFTGNDKMDFDQSKLPKNRIKQFIDILTNRFIIIIKISLLIFLFSIPALGVFIIGTNYATYIPKELEGASRDVLAARVFTINLVMYLILIPLIMIMFLGIQGASKVGKKLVWNEGIFVFSDFMSGIKENYKNALLCGFLTGAMLFICMSNFYFYLMIDFNKYLEIIFMVIIIFSMFIVLSACMIMINHSNYLKINIKSNLKNGLLFGTILLPINLGLCLITIVPIFIYLIFTNLYLQVGWLILLALFLLGIISIIWSLYSIYLLDKFILKNHQPDMANVGLAKEKEHKNGKC